MKPVKSVSVYIIIGLCVLFFPGCSNTPYNSTAPGAKKLEEAAALEAAASVHTTDAKVAYVFSDNIFTYQPCAYPWDPCPEVLTVGNPVHSYEIDTVSGVPSPKGIQVDSPPVNTKSLTMASSDRFLYTLTGDNLVYTFSIGYSIFTEAEFNNQNLKSLGLYNALSKAGYIAEAVLSSDDIIKQLNTLLEQPDMYDRIFANNPNVTETDEIKKLKAETISSRIKLFSDLAESEQKSVIRLNRLMIELVYPDKTPINKGARVLHAVGSPVATSSVSAYRSFASVEMEPLGKFAYVLGSNVSVYFRDQATGQLTLSATQGLGIGQIIFAPSGLIAYGSTNGSLQTYSINRSTGMFTELGAPFQFWGWEEGRDFNSGIGYSPAAPWQKAPFHNMAADPTGKFLYLIGSSGSQITTPPMGLCPSVESLHQLGSLIYTFIIDSNSGLLTQAGLPLDTTPHIIASASVDPKGRFVQLLNTHEYYPGSYTPDLPTDNPLPNCSGGNTSLLNHGAIYSYYIEQASGKLIPTGSVQAGGAQIPIGFVAGGMDSVSITGDVSGRFLYLLNSGDMYVYNVDQANGALTAVGSPLTGATTTAAPGKYEPVTWPSDCYTNGVWNTFCTFNGSRAHSLTWAGY